MQILQLNIDAISAAKGDILTKSCSVFTDVINKKATNKGDNFYGVAEATE